MHPRRNKYILEEFSFQVDKRTLHAEIYARKTTPSLSFTINSLIIDLANASSCILEIKSSLENMESIHLDTLLLVVIFLKIFLSINLKKLKIFQSKLLYSIVISIFILQRKY